MDRTPASVWNECLDIIRDNIGAQLYRTWFEPIKPIRLESGANGYELTVQLPSSFYYEWLEEHYYMLVRTTVRKVLGPFAKLYYDVLIDRELEDENTSSIKLPASMPPDAGPSIPTETSWNRPYGDRGYAPDGGRGAQYATTMAPKVESHLNRAYTFERFIEGDCNRLARSAALAIAQNPGATAFNPFLIYGGVGLGKTHLIQAIGNYVREYRKLNTVLYVSSERFTTDFVQAIQHNRVNDFSMYYRNIDLLVIDDAQFFSGKEKTQEEFFHIFNDLHQSGKQIVLSADRPPKDIEGIEERLLSRFQWGLSADMRPPDLETRIAILQRKAEDEGMDVPDDVIQFVGHNIKNNIRELEGALLRLLAHSTMPKRPIDLALAKEVLRDLIKDHRISLSIDEIQRIVCEYFDIPVDLVCDRTRKREVVQARQIAMYFCKRYTQHSLKTIGLHFGGRDHSTVIHANQSVENQLETDPNFLTLVDEIQHTIELRSR